MASILPTLPTIENFDERMKAARKNAVSTLAFSGEEPAPFKFEEPEAPRERELNEFGLPKTEFRQAPSSFVDKLPDPIRDFTESIQRAFVGEGQVIAQIPGITEPEIVFDTGLLGFLRPFGIGKPMDQKILDRHELLRPLVEKGIITEKRSDEISGHVAIPEGLKAVKLGLPVKKKKIELTPEEKKAIRPVVIEEALDQAFGALDVLSFGTLKPIARTVAQQIAKSKSFNEIAELLIKEVPDITREAAELFGKILTKVDNVDEVQKVLNRTQFALQEAKRTAGEAVDVKRLEPEAANVPIRKTQIITEEVSPILTDGSGISESVSRAGKRKASAALDELSDEVAVKLINRFGKTVAGHIADVGGEDLAVHALIKGTEDEIGRVLNLDETERVIVKLMDFLQEVKSPKAKTEELRSFERSKRAGTVAAILKKEKGKEAFLKAQASLKGELPLEEFVPPSTMTAREVGIMTNAIRVADKVRPFEKLNAYQGLGKLLGDPFFDGKLPADNEIKILHKIFGSDFALSVKEARPLSEKVKLGIVEILNVPRAIMSSMDMSAALRQGALLGVERPKEWTKAFGGMVRYFFDERYFDAAMNSIATKETAELRANVGLEFTDVSGRDVKLTEKEEGFQTNLAARIPLVGIGVRASERAFAGFLNKLRADSFDAIAKDYMTAGLDSKNNPEEFIALAKLINTLTGRTKLPESLKAITPTLNAVIWSPRLNYSRLQMFNPVWYFNLKSRRAQKIAVSSFLKFVGLGTMIVSLASLHPDAEVETDPISSDFGKIRIGRERWDLWGGFQQWLVLGVRLAMGLSKSASSGKIRELSPLKFPFNTRLDILIRFAFQKATPPAGLTLDLLRGQTLFGEPITIGNQALSRLVPLYQQDIIEVILEEEGVAIGFGVGVPAFFGVGTQSFGFPGEGGRFVPPKLRKLNLPSLRKFPRPRAFPELPPRK